MNVVISYATKNLSWVDKTKEAIASKDVTVFIAEYDAPAGQDLHRSIETAIENCNPSRVKLNAVAFVFPRPASVAVPPYGPDPRRTALRSEVSLSITPAVRHLREISGGFSCECFAFNSPLPVRVPKST